VYVVREAAVRAVTGWREVWAERFPPLGEVGPEALPVPPTVAERRQVLLDALDGIVGRRGRLPKDPEQR
jgi:hypothetical protein